VALLEGQRQSYPDTIRVPFQNSLLFTLAQRAGEPYANNLKELMCKVALQVAIADGPLSPIEQAELEALRNSSGATARPNDTDISAQLPNTDAATPTPRMDDQVVAVTANQRDKRPLIDPQFTCATGIVTIDILKEMTKKVIEALEPIMDPSF